MHAVQGDRLLVKGRTTGQAPHTGEILETQGPDGTPPFLVKWSNDGHVGLIFPGPDAIVEHPTEQAQA